MEQPAPFIVYNASAGSGKTYTIVKKYLSLLFLAKRNDGYKNILAITFTNKAVEEMKTRIIDSLIAFSEARTPAGKVDLLKDLVAETGLTAASIKEKSKRIVKNLVHNYAAFEVSTIDAFTNRILRTFAKDLGLSVNFDVELDVQRILEEAVDRIIAKAGKDPMLTNSLVNFAIAKADDDKSWDIARDLKAIALLLVNENNFIPLEIIKKKKPSDFRDYSIKLKKNISVLKNTATTSAEEFFELLHENALKPTDFSGKYLPSYFLKLQQENFKVGFGTKWQETIADGKLYPSRVPSGTASLIDQLQPQIAALFLKSREAVLQMGFYKEIDKNLTQLSLLNTIQQEVEEIKTERNLLLISDFNKEISAQVRNQPSPFIYERLGERYRDYFIDEFQDTSELQWQNLVPLIQDPLSSHDENGKQGSLTIVGDAKQAIYRWRGGKAEQFMALGSSAEANPFPVEKNAVELPSNYRSMEEIVLFNNSFFKHISQYLGFETHRELFKNAVQEKEKAQGGYVNISFIAAGDKEEKDLLYSEKTLEIIHKLEKNGYPKKDICILVRKKKEGITIAEHLSENNVPIISSETLLIAKSPKVQFINNLLSFSLNQKDDSLKVNLLYYLHENFPLKMDIHMFISKGLEFHGREFFDYLKEHGFIFQMKNVQNMALYNAVEYIVRSFGLMDGSNAYVQFYLDFVLDYTQKNRGGISGFIDHWKSKEDKLSIVAPEGENAVQIMTIHKAKGLEFPVVIYPFANETIDDTGLDNLWVSLVPPVNDIPVAYIGASKKLLDYGENASAEFQQLLLQKELDAMNMLYVACTRPKQQLYIISEWSGKKEEELKMNKFSHFFQDLLRSLGRWDESVPSYDFGEFVPNPSREETQSESSKPGEDFMATSTSPNHLNIMTRSGVLWGSAREVAVRQGTIFHEIMHFIGNRSDLENAVQKGVAQGIINSDEADLHRETLSKIMDHPDLRQYYEPGTTYFNERGILDAGGILRPDRINIEGVSACIIDYKTGEDSDKHILQINRYAQAVKNLGYLIDKKLLVYINDGVSVKIV